MSDKSVDEVSEGDVEDYIIMDEQEKEDVIVDEEEEDVFVPLPDSTPKELKIEGNKFFRKREIQNALMKYQLGIRVFEARNCEDISLKVTLHSNCAQCYLSMKDFDNVIAECNKSIELDPEHLKSLYRRALAHEMKEEYTSALPDLKKVVDLNPRHGLAVIALARVGPLAKEQTQKQLGELWSGIKDIGGKVLSTFGIDIGNINFQQNEEGGYSMSTGGAQPEEDEEDDD